MVELEKPSSPPGPQLLGDVHSGGFRGLEHRACAEERSRPRWHNLDEAYAFLLGQVVCGGRERRVQSFVMGPGTKASAFVDAAWSAGVARQVEGDGWPPG